MLVEAIYDNGRLLLPNHLSFAHLRFNIKVELPDAEIVNKVNTIVEAKIMPQEENVGKTNKVCPEEYLKFKELQNIIFGVDYHYVQEKNDKEILLEVLSEKYA